MCSILAYCGSGADPDKIAEMMEKTISRGPDDTRILNTGSGYLGFNRLSIMGLWIQEDAGDPEKARVFF